MNLNQINYFMYLNCTGYSIAAQEYIMALRTVAPDTDIRVELFGALSDAGISPIRRQLFLAMKESKATENCVNIYHCIPTRYNYRSNGNKNVGVCLFETINPPQYWINIMNQMHAIITASEFNKRVFEANGVKTPIYKIPHCFDPAMFNNQVTPRGRYDKFTFVAIGTWKDRKNWSSLIKGFYDAFVDNDNVCLLIKTDKPNLLQQSVQHIKKTSEWRTKKTAPIYAELTNKCQFEDIPHMMKKGDVYVCPSLGEGFGLGGLHAMACNIPVLTTRFGGSLEYALPEITTYIEPSSYRSLPTLDNIPQFKNTIWPVISVSEIRDKLRYMKDNFQTVKQKSAEAYKYVHNKFNYNHVGSLLRGAISNAV